MVGTQMRAGSGRRQSGVTLVELLVVIVIMSIVSTMILGTWFALTKAYAGATQSAKQRDTAQLAMERLVRELRDAQGIGASGGMAISPVDLGPYSIRFHTTFNMLADDDPLTAPHAVRYWLDSGTLYRQVDAGEEQAVVKNVVNETVGLDLFRYYFYDGNGQLQHSDGTSNLPTNTLRIKAVKVALAIDLQPGSSPEYMKIVNMVQLRNQRSF
jgi:prepilin-type N-terminal cleavage/methylation domain-containing protein